MPARVLLGFLLAHRANAELFRISFKYVETVALSANLVLPFVAWIACCRIDLHVLYSTRYFIEDLVIIVLRIPVLALIAAIDSLRIGSRVKLRWSWRE